VSDRDILSCVSALEVVLGELGYENFIPGAGVAAAVKVFTTI
jgi:aspartate aminotransferase-like enzyme